MQKASPPARIKTLVGIILCSKKQQPKKLLLLITHKQKVG
jgi:hypothetical protein